MKVKLLLAAIAVIFAYIFTSGFVAASDKKGAKEDKVAKVMAKYEKTGKERTCIQVSRIGSTKVIDDYNILFKMKGRKAYLNTLPYRCPRLGYERAFSYALSINQLCNVDLITVFDPTSSIVGATCGIGKFVEYKKKPIEKKVAKE